MTVKTFISKAPYSIACLLLAVSYFSPVLLASETSWMNWIFGAAWVFLAINIWFKFTEIKS